MASRSWQIPSHTNLFPFFPEMKATVKNNTSSTLFSELQSRLQVYMIYGWLPVSRSMKLTWSCSQLAWIHRSHKSHRVPECLQPHLSQSQEWTLLLQWGLLLLHWSLQSFSDGWRDSRFVQRVYCHSQCWIGDEKGLVSSRSLCQILTPIPDGPEKHQAACIYTI